MAKAGGNPDTLQSSGPMPAVWGDDRQLDLARTMERVPAMIDVSQTDFVLPFYEPDPAKAEGRLTFYWSSNEPVAKRVADDLVRYGVVHRPQLGVAIRDHDHKQAMRLAHSCKGACANVGANAVAAVLRRLEQQAAHEAFDECNDTIATLTRELARLRVEVEFASLEG